MQILSKTVQIFSVEDATAPFKFVTVELSNSGEHVIISQTNLINSPVIVLPPMWNWITTVFGFIDTAISFSCNSFSPVTADFMSASEFKYMHLMASQ